MSGLATGTRPAATAPPAPASAPAPPALVSVTPQPVPASVPQATLVAVPQPARASVPQPVLASVTPAAAQAPCTVLVTQTMRVRIGASPATEPTTLDALAHDPLPLVRAAVAMNDAAPEAADRHLAGDPDVRIRELLARKLANLLPTLSGSERDRMGHHACEVLCRLAADEAERVRTAIAEVVADMAQAPRALILKLAHDAAVPVSDPVLRLSPLLTDADLLALLVAPPHDAVATAIARRASLSPELCDVVLASADAPAIQALLANPAAAIREATLDALVRVAVLPGSGGSDEPGLPTRTAETLRALVLEQVMDMMTHQGELGVEVATELRRRLSLRVLPGRDLRGGNAAMSAAVALEEAFRTREQGRLDEAALLGAAQRGEGRLLGAMLSVAAGVPLGVVDRAARLRSAKGLVSLVWKAGFGMRVAGPVQLLLARLAPPQVLVAAADGGFPLEAQEMRWQVHFLSQVGW